MRKFVLIQGNLMALYHESVQKGVWQVDPENLGCSVAEAVEEIRTQDI